MRSVIRALAGFAVGGIVAWPIGAAAQSVSTTQALVAETENFSMLCVEAALCDASRMNAADRKAAVAGLKELQKARGWLEEMGFPVGVENLEKGLNGTKAVRLQLDRAKHETQCGSDSIACHILDPLYRGRMILPIENAGEMADGQTIVHEYVHALQPARDPGGANWINEMVATAIGTAWGIRNGQGDGVYEPKYSMVLDREFWDGKDDPGYGKWDYALTVGRRLGSQDAVAYLAQEGILNVSLRGRESAAQLMDVWYDAGLVKSATFDQVFPDYVARFNNIEEGSGGGGRTGRYLYYGDISRHEVKVPRTDAPVDLVFDGKVVPFAAHPMLMSLSVTPTKDSEPKDNILLAEVEIKDADDTLTLVREHRKAREKHKDYVLIDGNEAPDELGFYRVAHTPEPGATEAREFKLDVRTRPVLFEPPDCFQAGRASEMKVRALDQAPADNWKLKVDNGRVEGLSITPARAGKVKVSVEIESPVTRRETGLRPKTPEKTSVELGSFDVAGSDCMVRLEMGDAVATYVADGSYTEFRTPGGEAMYISARDLAMWRGGWQHVPAQAKTMILGGMQRNNALLRMEFPGAHDDEGDFMSQMPRIFAKRFSWSNLKKARAPEGGEVRRSATPCPEGGKGCTATTFSMDGVAIPVIFDAQDRPKVVTFDGVDVTFDYGTWDVRRPPGW
ncbi:hypothetical protein K1T73_03170 [Roseovarius sp. SCSIO 43702]|uniref:hypothetical protein n=1 Tax=Roseovarius sp. SCSIO 43702 TaxID=2823043 RepID=UPI001C7335D3|nr:hypothetical protein [Roseovarius sp. SCSIO 43702]QYX57417.1 hypothetical protein K1T73_03170 [Roseovarius sp. SCSIO 43702]